MLSVDDRFPLSFYYRLASQILNQAKVYRDEGNQAQLYQTLHRYSRLVSEIIPQHRSYYAYSSTDRLHHKKILNEVVKELERMKPVSSRTSEGNAERSQQRNNGSHLMQRLNMKDHNVASYGVGKVHCNSTAVSRSCRYSTNAIKGYVKLVPDIRIDKTGARPPQSNFPATCAVARDNSIIVHVVEHHFPSPVLSCVERSPLVGHVTHINNNESTNDHSPCEGSSRSKAVQDVHISARLMEEFMELASANTKKNLETCGILGASFKNQTFYVTTLIVPKQETTSFSCQALSEEEIHAIQDRQSLFPVGWIHHKSIRTNLITVRGGWSELGLIAKLTANLWKTHPSQTCFLSSIDLHTQYSYQIMLPEAIAIVMAPTDTTRSYGIFRLTDPGGITVLKECQESGFHLHPETCPDGTPIYESCSNVYINPNLRFEIIDLRSALSP